jgi:hydroxyacylglutathione hydrolase
MTDSSAASGTTVTVPLDLRDCGQGVHAIDSGYFRPRLDAIHFIADAGEVAIVDTGTAHSVPRILQALGQLGHRPEAVRHVLLTHVHLDHAAGAGHLMQALPEARLAVHSRGARHMADPARLWAATIEVYGEAHVLRDYGAAQPIDAARIDVVGEGAELALGRRRIGVLDVPGHARHHLAFSDSSSGMIFTGDVFGLSYRELDTDGQAFIIPTTSPSQFEPDAAHDSVDRILALRPRALCLTHYSQVFDVPRLGAMMHRLLDAHVAVAERCRGMAPGGDRDARLLAGIREAVIAEAREAGVHHAPDRIDAVLGLDMGLNAQGLGIWLDTPPR